ncbi:hypothetical protein HanRHA438_Chr04g0154401 [Helianthus annuus]|nr:hypothetical protein HanRHA438_Chr04g0154401 [Helianthus annuus]
MPCNGKELPKSLELRSRSLRDGRKLRHEMMLLLNLLSARDILCSLSSFIKLIQPITIL